MASVDPVPRLRLGVALLVPEPWATEIDGLRRALGAGGMDRVPPHLTLVPPVNVRVDAVADGLAVLRAAAHQIGCPLELHLGPVASFAPATPTLHLAVAGSPAALAALHRLRDAVFVTPFARPLTFAFTPHVTLDDDVDPARIGSAIELLRHWAADVRIDRVHLLQEQRHGDAHRRWVPVADVPLRPRRIVGRGGLELELTVSSLMDPEAQAWAHDVSGDGFWSLPEVEVHRCHRDGVVVVARHRGEVVGVVATDPSSRSSDPGGLAPTARVLVAPHRRRQGIGRHLLAAHDHQLHEARP